MKRVADALLTLKGAVEMECKGHLAGLVLDRHAYMVMQQSYDPMNYFVARDANDAESIRFCGIPVEREGKVNEDLTRALSDILDLVDDGILQRNTSQDQDGVRFAQDGLRLLSRLKAGQRALARSRGVL